MEVGPSCSAGDLARHFPAMSRPAVSRHLRVLVGAGLIAARRDGNRRLYRPVRPPTVGFTS
ncbi:helix-turn-helix domain-containing protein [Saccharothrix deserti]|uniref:helix-turn-helix domain-containing protein n=1 Tax=Saccharothrix deserti TaxID=2593674 RepID=UPI00192E6C0D